MRPQLLALVLLPLFDARALAGTIFCRQLDSSAAFYTLAYESNADTREKMITSVTANSCREGKVSKQTAYNSFAASPIDEKFPYGRYIVSNSSGGGLFFSLDPTPSVCPNIRPWPPAGAAASASSLGKKGCFSGELVDISWLQDGDDPTAFFVKIACSDIPYIPPQPCRTKAGPVL